MTVFHILKLFRDHSHTGLDGSWLPHLRSVLRQALQVLGPEVEEACVRTQELFRLSEVPN